MICFVSNMLHKQLFWCQSFCDVHLIFVHIIFSSVWVAKWPPFGKELPTLLIICSHTILTIFISYISRFGFEGGIWVLIAQVPGHCTFVTFFQCFVKRTHL